MLPDFGARGLPLRQGVALCGFMGVGKTTVGRAVAQLLGADFVDLDEVVVARHGSIASQLERDGEGVFRARESVTLEWVLSHGPCVLATGGGSVADEHNRALLHSWGFTATLHAPLETLGLRPGVASRPLWGAARTLWAERQAAYADADLHVDATAAPEAVAQRIVCAVNRGLVRIRGSQPVVVDPGPLGADAEMAVRVVGGARDVFAVTDARVAGKFGARAAESLEVRALSVVPPGERHKNLRSYDRVVNDWLTGGVHRKAVALAIGGGSVTDLGGFVAATILRGIPWVAWPTTLLAMVDASVGGKTGLDHRGAKNVVGAFHAPRLSWSSLPTLSSLHPRKIRAGLAEVVKVALVTDAALFETLEAAAPALAKGDYRALPAVVARAVTAKMSVVDKDPFEQGGRICLNAGHTVAHVIEAASKFAVPHGEAVAMGLVCELRWAAARGMVTTEDLNRVVRLLIALRLPVAPPRFDRTALRSALVLDKKGSGDTVVVPVPVGIGAWSPVSLAWSSAETLIASLQ